MVDLPAKKVGIVSCSGEELPEGTITRLAALKVLEKLRPADTVTICLPLFLAGGEGDRAFAKFYPTIAVDGCELRCAARATEMYSSKPAASIMVRELIAENGLDGPHGRRRLDAAGLQAVEVTAEQIADTVDELLEKRWDRRAGTFIEFKLVDVLPAEPVTATCECGSGIPIQKIDVSGQQITFIALPLIFQQFREAGKLPDEANLDDLMEIVKVYTPVPDGQEQAYAAAVLHEYAAYCDREANR
jgi:hypothetical protein